MCGSRERCGLGDRATDARTFQFLGVDPGGKMYFGYVNGRQKMIEVVGLDGRFDRVIGVPFVGFLAFGRGGELYFAEYESFEEDEVVWKWDPDTKRVTRFAGRPHLHRRDFEQCGREAEPTCELDQHVPATKALLGTVTGLAVDRQGRLLISDAGHFAVHRVNRDGTMTTIAGTGRSCDGAEPCQPPGLAATRTRVTPIAVATGRDGATWFTTSSRDVYRIGPSGTLRRIWAPATDHLLSPLAVDRNNNAVVGYWPTDAYARLVRVSPDGRWSSVLDVGAHPDRKKPRTFGDGLLAASAGVVHQVASVATSRNGDIYFTDQSGEVRYIPAPGRPPARLALAVFAPATARLNGAVRITFRVDRAATIAVRVAPQGIAQTLTTTPRTSGSVIWHPRAADRRLARGPFVLQIIATDARGRSATRIIP